MRRTARLDAPITVVSLFAGIGGFDLGLERAGMQVKWQVEIDPFCRAVLAKHWPEVKRYEDVRTVRSELEPVDLVVGGDPCQRNSNAWRHGDGDPSLGLQFLRVVDSLRPRLVLRENPTAVRRDAPWPWHRFKTALEQFGYAVVPFRVRSCCVGADYRRDRLFLLAEHASAQRPRLEGDEREILARTDEGRQDANVTGSDRWYAAPRICRGADGIPHRVDRCRVLGNAVVPDIAEFIGSRLMAAA